MNRCCGRDGSHGAIERISSQQQVVLFSSGALHDFRIGFLINLTDSIYLLVPSQKAIISLHTCTHTAFHTGIGKNVCASYASGGDDDGDHHHHPPHHHHHHRHPCNGMVK